MIARRLLCPAILLAVAIGTALTFTASYADGDAFATDKFRQLDEILPTPNDIRTASGAPGPAYWQQRADYRIDVELDDADRSITGSEKIHYVNRSPHTLSYLWVQLDNNIFSPQSHSTLTETSPVAGEGDDTKIEYDEFRALSTEGTFDGSIHLGKVEDGKGHALDYTVVGTAMRIDLQSPLAPKATYDLSIAWHYRINDAKAVPARGGYEYFAKDGNCIYEIAHWYPRMASYTDVTGWQNKEFLGAGEFTLEFGNFEVHITVPADHIVAATGVLQNPKQVLTAEQRRRLDTAGSADKPVFIVTTEEALANEKSAAEKKKTWIFKAENVRDFAFASSRKFIWDAQRHKQGANNVWAMSFYPNEAEPLWSQYSTNAVIHTLEVYSKHTFDYPYPAAIAVNGPVGGMEYPMICFNKPRPEADSTYFATSVDNEWQSWEHTKYGLISVIIHEVGHNFFPMVVNSDERQWTWMDEGLNQFLEYLAEQEWEANYPGWSVQPRGRIIEYMTSDDQVPIMTNSESILQFDNNAYRKPNTALIILRETILGRELFDYAFKQYARRWMFKRPMPADFFRTMEDASGVDLDWFWRGWFYSTDYCDIALRTVEELELDTRNPDVEKPKQREREEDEPKSLTAIRDEGMVRRLDRHPELKDFYNDYDEYAVTDADRKEYQELLDKLEDWEKALLETTAHIYRLNFENVGGLVMPIILDIEYKDGDHEEMRIPAEIWRKNAKKASKLILCDREISRITLDPHLETADADLTNNDWPSRLVKTRLRLHKDEEPKNPMQKAREEAKGQD